MIMSHSGPVAIETNKSWMGAIWTHKMEFSLTFTSSHVLRVDVISETAILGLEVT